MYLLLQSTVQRRSIELRQLINPRARLPLIYHQVFVTSWSFADTLILTVLYYDVANLTEFHFQQSEMFY